MKTTFLLIFKEKKKLSSRMLSGVRLLPSSHVVEGLIIELVFYDKTMKLSLSLLFFMLHNIHHTLVFTITAKMEQTIAPHLRAWRGSVRWESVRQERGNSFDPVAWTGNAGRCRGSLEGGCGEEIRIKQKCVLSVKRWNVPSCQKCCRI